MKRTGKTVETGGERKHRGAQCTADQVGGVGADVSTLVVRVDGEIQTHQFDKVFVGAVAELVGQVEAVILILLDWSNLAILEDISVDLGGDGWELGNQVHGVLEGVLPVFLLVDTLGIGLGEGGLLLKSGDGKGELSHWVEVRWASVDELLDELGDVRSSGPVGGKITDLLFGWDFSGQEQPEETCQVSLVDVHPFFFVSFFMGVHTFWERLLTTGGLGENLLAVGDLQRC